MVTTEDQFAADATRNASTGRTSRRLERSVSDRMLSGVAAGLARYLNVDANVIRIGFVVLSFFGGIGIILYAASWIMMPEEGSPPTTISKMFTGTRRHVVLRVIALGALSIVVVSLLSEGPLWDLNGWRAGRELGVLIGLAILGILALQHLRPYVQRAPRRISVRRILLRISIAFVGLFASVVLVAFVALLITGVSLRGGIGSKQWRPTSAAQVSANYRTGIGNATVDLREVSFPKGATHVTASVAIGRLLVEVPPGVTVSLAARSGVGSVNYGNEGQHYFTNGINASNARKVSGPVLVLDAEAGIGEVQLIRGQAR